MLTLRLVAVESELVNGVDCEVGGLTSDRDLISCGGGVFVIRCGGGIWYGPLGGGSLNDGNGGINGGKEFVTNGIGFGTIG